MGNKLLSSNSKVPPTGEGNDEKLELPMGSDNIVDSSFLPPKMPGTNKTPCIIPFVVELENGSGIQNACIHLRVFNNGNYFQCNTRFNQSN